MRPASRVAYLCVDPGVPVHGTKGASVHVQEVVRAFRARGAEVRLYCTRTGDHPPSDLADIPVTRLRIGATGGLDPAQREHAQQDAASALARRAAADGVDLVYERYSLFSTALASIVAATSAPGVLEVNAPLIEEQRTHRVLVDEGAARVALTVQARAASRIAAVSDPVADWVRRQVPDAADKVVVAPNGVNVDRLAPAPGGRPTAPPTVIFVGTLKPWHGVELLIEAAARATVGWRLVIVGDGPLARPLREQATRLGVDVEFRGALAPHDVPAALASATIGVAPYPADDPGQTQYFSPLKVYEYSAAGLPVVASRVGQLPAAVRHEGTGLLVPPGDATALAAALDRLAADPALARRMGRAGRERMTARHTWGHVLDTVLADV